MRLSFRREIFDSCDGHPDRQHCPPWRVLRATWSPDHSDERTVEWTWPRLRLQAGELRALILFFSVAEHSQDPSGQIIPPLTTFLTTSLETSRIDEHRLDRLEALILVVLSWLVRFWGVD